MAELQRAALAAAVMAAASIVSAASGISKPAALLSVLGGRSELIGITRKASIVGLIISIGVIVGAFIYTWVSQDVQFGSISANTLIADAVSGIIIAVVLFAIALSTVGAILVAIVGVIDLIFLGLCQLGVDALCFSIIGGWVEGLARLVYSGDVAIDTTRDDLVTFRGIKGNLINPGLGLQVGNSMAVTATIRTRIYQTPPSSEYSTAYASADDIFTEANLRAASFNYRLSQYTVSISASRNEMSTAWQDVRKYGYANHPLYGTSWYWTGYKDDVLSSGAIPLTAGVNEGLDVRFWAGIAIPSYECWFAVCSTDKAEKATYRKDLGDTLYYDIFPRTLDGFHNVRSWGFSFQKDWDGDGLLNPVQFHGTDPDDSTWDADHDGLPDPTELRYGTSQLADTDHDGLTDLEEVRLDTNPLRADGDNDGLTDKQELDGWVVEYTPGKFTRMTSEPNNPDTDLDGLSDLLEKNLGAPFNPRVENPRPVALYNYTNDSDSFIKPGFSVAYTTTVRNEVTQPWWATGSLSIVAPAVLGGQSVTQSFVLGSGQEITQRRSLQSQANAASQNASVSESVFANLDQNSSGSGSLGFVSYQSALPLTIDNDRPTSAVAGSGFVAAGGQRILGISASDPTSSVSRVQVRVQNGNWMDATPDGKYWLFNWDVPAAEGEYVIFTRATDAVGWDQTPDASTSIYVDAHAPDLTTSLANNQILAAQHNSQNRWSVPVSGVATDPTFGKPASGIAAVDVRLSPNGDGWQPASVITTTNPSNWSIDYALTALDSRQAVLVDPTGFYTVEVRSRDHAGNETAAGSILTRHIKIDNTAPQARLNGMANTTTIGQAVTLNGVVRDNGAVAAGVGSVELALVPAEVAPTLNDRALSLPLNETPQATIFEDVSGLDHTFYCIAGQCPSSGAAGRFDTAVSFNGSNQYLDALQLSLPLTNFSTSLWFNTTCANCGLFAAVNGQQGTQGHDRDIYLSGGKVCANLQQPNSAYETICSIENNFNDGQWHNVVHSVGTGGQQLFVDGVLRVRGFLTASNFSQQTSVNLGFSQAAGAKYLAGSLDEVTIYNTALSAPEAATLFQAWQLVQLDQPGAVKTAWHYTLPSGLEGFYQIDVRSTDLLGNRNDRRQDWRQWRGEIDTAVPQVSIQVEYSGEGQSAQTHYSGTAADLNLVETGFVSPCGDQSLTRGYYNSPWWATWSNNTQRLNQISFSCTVPGYQTDNVHIRACDLFGHCSATQPDLYRIFWSSFHRAYQDTPDDGRIQSVNTFDGGDWKQLLSGLTSEPVGLALDIPAGKMYWSEIGHTPNAAKISRANLDGSNPETLVTGINASLLGPKTLSIALDHAGGKLYWTSQNGIFRSNLDGSGAELLFHNPGQYNVAGVLALDLSAGKMYWTVSDFYGPGFDSGSIWSADLSGLNAKVILDNIPRITTLAFDQIGRAHV